MSDPVEELQRMVEGLEVASGFRELNAACEQGKPWNASQIMVGLNDTNHRMVVGFRETVRATSSTARLAQINSARLDSVEEVVSDQKKDLIGRVKTCLNKVEEKVVTKEQLNKALEKSGLAKEVHFLERNVTIDEKGFCTLTLILHGLKIEKTDGYEKPNETMILVKERFLRALGLSPQNVTLLAANRLPKGRNSNKPPPIKLKFLSPNDVHIVLENLHKLKNNEACKGLHIERDVPLMLTPERKKAKAIAYQYRKTHGKEYVCKITYPRNKAQVSVKKRDEAEFKDLSSDEMDQLLRQSKESYWADEAEEAESQENDQRGQRGRDTSKKRQRATPGQDRTAKEGRFSDLFT